MNWATALHDVAEHGATDPQVRRALARDTVYMPSDVAARLLPIDAVRGAERLVRDFTAPDADRRALGR
jgi:hypothetical protein